LRLDPGLRFWNYAALTTLTLTGVIWLVADMLKTSEDELWQAIAANMLMLHGMTAMIALVLLGAVAAQHVRYSWRKGKNRISGAVMVGANAGLVTTAWGLYYAGSDLLRTFAADVHIAVGIALPALVATHVVLGRRTRKHACAERSRTDFDSVEPLTGVVAGLVRARPKTPALPGNPADGSVAAE
jgi:Na+-translocating ferredoxin:NAD+ oxidoreductase RnfE subunit